jgi:hypothetical protein
MLPAAPLAAPMLARRAEVGHCRTPAGTEGDGLGAGDEVPGAVPDGAAAGLAADGAAAAGRVAGACRVIAEVCTAGALQAVASSTAQAAAAAGAAALAGRQLRGSCLIGVGFLVRATNCGCA